MDFRLEGYLEFNGQVDTMKRELTTIFEQVNERLFRKGVPRGKEGSAVTRWSAKGARLSVTIEGTTYLRPHDALLRLRNYLGEQLGKSHRLGVRDVFVKQYTIFYKPEQGAQGEVKINVPWVKRITKKGAGLVVVLQDLRAEALEDRYVEKILRRIDEKISQSLYGGKAEHWDLLWTSPPKEPVWDKDPTPEMEKRGWVKRFDVGVWLHTPVSARVFRAFFQIVLEHIIESMGFEEVILPKITPLEVWLRTGHVPGSSNSFYYVSRPKSWDPQFWEDFADQVKVTNKVPYELLQSKLDPPSAGICFAQCPPLYWYFEKKRIPQEELPYKFWDASGVSYRWEGGGLHGLDRDSEFHRIELIWFGTKEQCLEIKDQVSDRYSQVFNNILDLEWRLARVTPWYMAQAGHLAAEEDNLKGTIDYEAWLPWRGPRDQSEWLEFQNLTVAGTKFSEAWNFKTTKGEEIWTGCSGIGLERWATAFLSQKGLDPAKWPEPFAKAFGKMPKEIRLA